MSVARAAAISVDLVTGDVTVDLFDNDPANEHAKDNPGMFAEDFFDTIKDDGWPKSRKFIVLCNDEAREMLGAERTRRLFGE